MSDRPGTTYRDAGVDIDAGDELVERIKPLVRRTQRPEVLGGHRRLRRAGRAAAAGYREPVLVSGTDGVGTKLRLAIDTGRHDTIGIDLVAMCVNDVVVQGAEPLFFLDYFATGKLSVDVAEAVIGGIAEGCEQAGARWSAARPPRCPACITASDYDLAGFCVGVVEKAAIIDGSRVRAGDAIIGLASSGPHSNGYSLIRKLVSMADAGPGTQLEGRSAVRPSARADPHLREAAARADARRAGARPRPHHRRRPHRQHPARAAGGHSRWCSRARAGRATRCSTGCSTRRGSTRPRCTAPSTAASAWWSIVPAEQAQAAVQLLNAHGEHAQLIGEVRAGGRGVVIARMSAARRCGSSSSSPAAAAT